jgi:pyruvate dehydrogenase E1 component alpha subunit
MGDAMEYMPKEERKAAMAADPVPAFRAWLLENGHATEAQLAEIEDKIVAMVDDAVEFAMNSPEPSLDELYTDVYEEITK